MSQRILQLNPPIWLMTPKGQALAHFLIDEGPDFDVIWGCAQQETGEWWWWDNSDVRAVKNMTLGRLDNDGMTLDGLAKQAWNVQRKGDLIV